MIDMPNSHLVLHKEALKQKQKKIKIKNKKNKMSIKHLIEIINLGAKNCPVGRSGLRAGCEIVGWLNKRN